MKCRMMMLLLPLRLSAGWLPVSLFSMLQALPISTDVSSGFLPMSSSLVPKPRFFAEKHCHMERIAKCSNGPLPLRGPLQFLLPQAVRCKSPLGCLLIALEGGKIPQIHSKFWISVRGADVLRGHWRWRCLEVRLLQWIYLTERWL